MCHTIDIAKKLTYAHESILWPFSDSSEPFSLTFIHKFGKRGNLKRISPAHSNAAYRFSQEISMNTAQIWYTYVHIWFLLNRNLNDRKNKTEAEIHFCHSTNAGQTQFSKEAVHVHTPGDNCCWVFCLNFEISPKRLNRRGSNLFVRA